MVRCDLIITYCRSQFITCYLISLKFTFVAYLEPNLIQGLNLGKVGLEATTITYFRRMVRIYYQIMVRTYYQKMIRTYLLEKDQNLLRNHGWNLQLEHGYNLQPEHGQNLFRNHGQNLLREHGLNLLLEHGQNILLEHGRTQTNPKSKNMLCNIEVINHHCSNLNLNL